jgi:ABC-2 type transport system permease protein
LSNLRGAYIIWYRDLLRFWRDRARLITSFAMPFLFLVIFATGIASVFEQDGDGGFDYINFVYPGIIGMVVLFTSIMTGVSVVWDREFGFLKEVLVAPISRTSVAIGKALGGATIATIQGTLMLVFIPFADVSLSVGGAFLLIALMFVFALSLTSMGLLIASRIRSMEAFQVVVQMILFPLFFVSTAMFPTMALPPWLGTAVKFNPVSYGIDALRQAVLGAQESAMFGIDLFGYRMPLVLDVAVIALFGLIMGTLAVRSFHTTE